MNDGPRFAQVNGIRVAYDLDGAGFPLVALHGFPRNRKVWRKLTPLLAARFQAGLVQRAHIDVFVTSGRGAYVVHPRIMP